LSLIPGLRLWEIDADCCGIAGTYGFKVEKREISEAVGWPIVQQVHEANADLVVCDTETCRWQIQALTGGKSIHPVELLAEAYGITVENYRPPVQAERRAPAPSGW